MKEPRKQRPAYGVFQTLYFLFRQMWKSNHFMIPCIFLLAPVTVVASYLGILLSTEVVRTVTSGIAPTKLVIMIALLSLGLMLAHAAREWLSAKIDCLKMCFDNYIQKILFEKTLNSDYELMESPEGLNRLARAMAVVGSDSGVIATTTRVFASFLANVIGIAAYTSILSALHPLLILAVALPVVLSFFALKYMASWEFQHRDNWKAADRKVEYIGRVSEDFSRGKDIRLYGMSDWLKKLENSAIGERAQWSIREMKIGIGVDAISTALTFIREVITYGTLIAFVVTKGLSAPDFIYYAGILTGFSAYVRGIVENFDTLNRSRLSFCDVQTCLDYPDRTNRGAGVPLPESPFSIEFRDVSFRYAGAEQNSIDHINLTIKAGEKIAVVGLNGAGKTTLVKLISGLYEPTEGTIYVNGEPVNAYNRMEYYKLYAAVFQDIFILPLSIASNISGREEGYDMARIVDAIKLAGLEDKIRSLPRGVDTLLVKSVHDDAVDLSGGEIQKLALARALYKMGNGKSSGLALLLDEPTAALDPIAESRIYEEYNRMTAGCTALFISHRLASTRFCDRILYMENGHIAEEGTHDSLMKAGGTYAYLFETQSQYYNEAPEGEEAEA